MIIAALLASTPLLASVAPSLPLECTPIPESGEQLCVIRTESRYGPFDEVVYYHLDGEQRPSLLGSEDGGVATFGGIGFSDGGKYMWLGWAEEGHPHFTFYRTQQFIANGIQAEGISTLGEYEFQWFLSFSDSGLVRYAIDEEVCRHSQQVAHYWSEPGSGERYCSKLLQIDNP